MAQLGSTKVFGDLKVTGELKAQSLSHTDIIAFDVASSTSIAEVNKQTFNTVYVNKGNAFSTANSRFTAPIKGTYIFYYTSIKNANSASAMRYYLRKNGSILYGSRHLRLDEVTAYGTNAVLTWVVDLEINDYIEVWVYVGASYASVEYNYFNGFLVG